MSKCTDSCTVLKQRYDEDPYCLQHGTVSFKYEAGDLLEDNPNQYAQAGRVSDKVWDAIVASPFNYTYAEASQLVGCTFKSAGYHLGKAKKRKARASEGVPVLEM